MASAIETLSHNIGHATVVIPGAEPTTTTTPTFPNGIISTGRITFPDNRRSRARFMRVSPDASIFYVNSLLKHWCDGAPSLVISITGGAKAFTMSSRLSRAFQHGLLKVARTTGAWIITGGMNKGIMESVGQLIRKNPDPAHPIHLIGIPTWGCVSGHEQLESSEATTQYFEDEEENKGQAPLEPNHTEFILVDDGTNGKYGGEIEFRARLEEAISGGFFALRSRASTSAQDMNLMQSGASKADQSDSVPVVLIVVEGGPNTIRTVHKAVVRNSIPAVFLDGTGRCCNLFAKTYRLYNEHREKLELTKDSVATMDPNTLLQRYDILKKNLHRNLEEDLKNIHGDQNPATVANAREKTDGASERAECFELVYECVHKKHNFLNIITLDPRNPVEPDIDLAILRALLSALSGSDSTKTHTQKKREQLRLALEWDRVDVAENHIMKNEKNWEKIVTNELFALALSWNQTAFIQLFLDHRFSLLNFCRENDPKVKTIIHQLNIEADKNAKRLKAFEDSSRMFYVEKIYPLVRNFFQTNDTLGLLHQTFPLELNVKKNRTTSIISTSQPKHRLDFEQKLFLWALVTGRRDLAMLFWSRGKNKICAALIATLIFKKLSEMKDDNGHSQSALEFESLAVKSLHRLHQTYPDICSNAIIREIHAYGGITWLELAVAAEAKEFVAHQAVQEVLHSIWFGHIDQNVSHLKIIFSTITIWYSGFLSYNTDLVTSRRDRDLTETSDSNQADISIPQRTLENTTTSNGEMDPAKEKLIDDASGVKSDQIRSTDRQTSREKAAKVKLRYFNKIYKFVSAPYVKFLYNLYFHVIFLLLFSYMILCDFFPLYDFPSGTCAPTADSAESKDASDGGKSEGTVESLTSDPNMTNASAVVFALQKQNRPSVIEFIVLIWIITLISEEIRQLVTTEAQSLKHVIVEYFQAFWNQLDVFAIVLYFVGFSLRFINNGQCFCAARIILAIDLIVWFMRILHIFTAVKRLGPKLVMIGEMFQDLKAFMIMLSVFILSFGIASHSLIYGVQKFSFHLPRRIINVGYWPMFGELKIMETFEQHFGALGYVVFIFLVTYMTIVSILLINLLIAMFSNIFDRLQTDTDRIWKFQRYGLVYEYLSRPVLPPPLILFAHIWRLSFFAISRCCKSKWLQEKYRNHTRRMRYKKVVDTELVLKIQTCEDASADEVYYKYLKSGGTPSDKIDIDDKGTQSPQENTLEKIRSLEASLQMMNKEHTSMLQNLTAVIAKLEAKLDLSVVPREQHDFYRDQSIPEETAGAPNDIPNRVLRLASIAEDGTRFTDVRDADMQPEKINRPVFRSNVTDS